MTSGINEKFSEIGRELARIESELRSMLGLNIVRKTPYELMCLGLTFAEAQAWLAQEPNYGRCIFKLPDDFFHDDDPTQTSQNSSSSTDIQLVVL